MRLQGLLLSVTNLTTSQRRCMFALMDRYYQNVTPARFEHDLAGKEWVILLRQPGTQAICGFSTQGRIRIDVAGRSVTALFSGDTIIAAEHRGDVALSGVWGRLALALIDRQAPAGATSAGGLYWFLISKGYKTYRFLPLFFGEFYPRHDVPTPSAVRQIIDALAQHMFGPAYDAGTGVVRADAAKDRLRPGVADLTPARLRDPHVAFFARCNPQHAAGAELCCLAPLTRRNFTAAAYRVIAAATAAPENSRGADDLAQQCVDGGLPARGASV